MRPFLKKLIRRTFFFGLLLLFLAWGVIAWNAWRAEPLQLWHTYIPREMTPDAMDAANWQTYITQETAIFEDLRRAVSLKLSEEEKTVMNRYYEGALVYPPKFPHDWNRSYTLLPEGEPKGAVVLLHGLTDSPYSLRHLARLYAEKGFVAFGLRLPGHGTVPAGLVPVAWQEWMAATRLAVREASMVAGKEKPLHMVGFSNGGALAVKYVMDALEDPDLPRPDRIVLLSPMIGITRFARFAGLTAVPALLPAFANAAWLSVLPEFNPFKYNSFPVNGARQSHLLCKALQSQIVRLSRTEAFSTLPPMLSFQSVLDHTVSTPALIYHLYAYLPENGSELFLFDINQASLLGGLMHSGASLSLQKMLPKGPQRYTLCVLKNRAPGDIQTMQVTRAAGRPEDVQTPLALIYPKSVFSLSHGAIPFPMNDPLYGMTPSAEDATRYGVNLGNLSLRGERGALMIPMDAMLRMSSNPFYPILQDQVEKGIDDPHPPAMLPALIPQPAHDPGVVEDLVDDFLKESGDEDASGATIF